MTSDSPKMEKLGEYDDEMPLSIHYCNQMTIEEYEDETTDATHQALQDLMKYVENKPEVYKKIIAKRKIEDEENAGMLSYLKVKLLVAFLGEDYVLDNITTEECLNKINNFQDDICEIFNYAQDSKQKPSRFSKRLATRRCLNKLAGSPTTSRAKSRPTPNIPLPPSLNPASTTDENSLLTANDLVPMGRPSIHRNNKKQKKSRSDQALMSPPPPPPPPPPAAMMSGVLQDSTNKVHNTPSTPKQKQETVLPCSDGKLLTSRLKSNLKHYGSTASLSSIGCIQNELLTFDKKSLRSVNSLMSPDGTPQQTPRTRRLMSTPVVAQSINNAFNTQMLDKFKNIRSPPSDSNSPGGFNSSSGFTP